MAKIEVDLVDYMGDDVRVVNAARVSFNKESDWADSPCFEGAKELKMGDAKLLSYLAKHNHFTPFTHPQITLRETVPIFVARQRFKHVVGFTYNEISRRYVDEDPEFYEPDSWRSRPDGSVKQGSGEDLEDKDKCFCTAEYDKLCEEAYHLYVNMLAIGVAPEQARMVLPQSMMTSYYVTGSLAAFARMVKQRKDSHAQREIQDLANLVDDSIRPLFPVSWSSLVDDD